MEVPLTYDVAPLEDERVLYPLTRIATDSGTGSNGDPMKDAVEKMSGEADRAVVGCLHYLNCPLGTTVR